MCFEPTKVNSHHRRKQKEVDKQAVINGHIDGMFKKPYNRDLIRIINNMFLRRGGLLKR